MSIVYNEKTGLFQIATKHSAYQIKIDDLGILQHIYYGAPVGDTDMSFQNWQIDRGFSGNPYEKRTDRTYSFDTLPMEYTGANVGDYRVSALALTNANGSRSCDFRYKSHEIKGGKFTLEGLPYVRGTNDHLAKEEDAQTLEIILEDSQIGLQAKLLYGVFEKKDVITRTVIFKNIGTQGIVLDKAASLCMDFPHGKYDLIHFHGRHCMERTMERIPVTHNGLSVASTRGMSSHHQNPFVILCDKNTTETCGGAYGFMMMYSGNHKTEVEMSFTDSTRVVMGINDFNFSWDLKAGASFTAPEVIMSYTSQGLQQLSHNYHHIIRENVIPARFYDMQRPILVNNWEATYFNFTTEKILALADEAANIGIEMLVLDDGWFGIRNDDNSGLGDWFVNEEKLPGGLKVIANGVNARGMKFGLWFEPEMVNEDSDLFRAHPEWAIRDPKRTPNMSRNQMVLDMSRKDVQDYLFERMSAILRSANIEYVKWDFNRSVANVYSNALDEQHQGEVSHRFILGTYALLERLLKAFPDLMIEGCAGGGGRFDAGMLFYCPQIWTSDDTDPVARLKIQEGTSYGYPVSSMGSHVSAVPNHQTGRVTSLETRGVVAMSGTFGYELDLTKCTEEEKNVMRKQIADFHKYYWLIQKGEYFRLSDEHTNSYFTCWEFAAPDQSEALVNLVITDSQANPSFPFVHLHGLDPDAVYALEGSQETYSGAALMNGGYVFGNMFAHPATGAEGNNYPTCQLHFVKIS